MQPVANRHCWFARNRNNRTHSQQEPFNFSTTQQQHHTLPTLITTMASEVFGDSLASFHDIAFSSYHVDDINKLVTSNQSLPVQVASLKSLELAAELDTRFCKPRLIPSSMPNRPLLCNNCSRNWTRFPLVSSGLGITPMLDSSSTLPRSHL